MTEHPSETERAIAAHLRAGELERVAVLTLEAYADELLGFLFGVLRDETSAREVFSIFAEDLWQGLPRLELKSSMRAWCYALARNAARRYLERDVRKQRRMVPLSAAAVISRVVAEVRTATAPAALTHVQQQIEALRARLSNEERELLTLRVDRGLSFREIAEALGDDCDVERALLRHRKRFQLIKQKLARWARELGIVPSSEP